jgi:ribosomal protein S18 acetylase RimI-like enzyme
VSAKVVRAATSDDANVCADIVASMPEFFTDDVPAKVRVGLTRDHAWVITSAERVVGFAIVEMRSTAAAEITWAAVRPESRGNGLGAALVEHVLGELARKGVAVVEVKTLDASANYPPYEATRAFWEHRGFVQVDTIDPLPGWQPGNPSAIYVAALAPTR